MIIGATFNQTIINTFGAKHPVDGLRVDASGTLAYMLVFGHVHECGHAAFYTDCSNDVVHVQLAVRYRYYIFNYARAVEPAAWVLFLVLLMIDISRKKKNPHRG